MLFWTENQHIIERPDQGHLYPLGEPRDTCHSRCANLRPPAPQARALPKELSRQLICWLFGTSTWPEVAASTGPLHLLHKVRNIVRKRIHFLYKSNITTVNFTLQRKRRPINRIYFLISIFQTLFFCLN